MTEPRVVRNGSSHRFEAKVDGHTAFAEYRLYPDYVLFPHTVVPPELEGRGIGSALVKAGLAFAEKRGLKVVPTCSFFRAWMLKHPETLDRVHESYREKMTAAQG